ncbi:MAG: PorP/SprF family type IX secretion system membrane protein [Bacteroidales bacterium]|nr:PorP/SprF family type IX secretion system membrane protein [Bacteroidales bacterium]
MKVHVFLFTLSFCAIAGAQDLPVYNQYFPEYEILNPAFSGKQNCYAVTLSDHHQWLGLKAAPNTQFAYARGRFTMQKASNYHGVGIILARDQNGSYRNMEADLIYAYHVRLSDAGKMFLSLGLSAAIEQTVLDEGDFYNYNNDPVISGARLSAWNPDLAVGVGLYSNVFFGGVTAANLLPSIDYIADPQTADRNQRLYTAIAGIKVKARKSDIEVEPSVVFIYHETLYGRIDLNLKGIYRQRYWIGFSLRKYFISTFTSGVEILPSAGIQIRSLEIAYSYGLGFSSMQRHSYGSHTLMLGWKLCGENSSAVPCPAYQ